MACAHAQNVQSWGALEGLCWSTLVWKRFLGGLETSSNGLLEQNKNFQKLVIVCDVCACTHIAQNVSFHAFCYFVSCTDKIFFSCHTMHFHC